MTGIGAARNYQPQTSFEGIETALNKMVVDWKKKFDNPPSAPFLFSVNERGKLCLDNVIICDIEDVNPEDLSCEADAFFIGSLRNGLYYELDVIWPFGGEARISAVALVLFEEQ